jgi:hypothetical protein
MPIFLLHEKSGGHGRSMQFSAYQDLIGYFGMAIVGSIETDTASLDTAHYRSEPILVQSIRTALGFHRIPSLLRNQTLS